MNRNCSQVDSLQCNFMLHLRAKLIAAFIKNFWFLKEKRSKNKILIEADKLENSTS